MVVGKRCYYYGMRIILRRRRALRGFFYLRQAFRRNCGKKATVFISRSYDDGIVAPYRKGYNFKGWAIEKDGQPVYGKPRVKNNLLLTFDAGEIEEVPDGATLYAVWEKAR